LLGLVIWSSTQNDTMTLKNYPWIVTVIVYQLLRVSLFSWVPLV